MFWKADGYKLGGQRDKFSVISPVSPFLSLTGSIATNAALSVDTVATNKANLLFSLFFCR